VDAFAVATDALFADPNIARDAVWPDQVVGFGDSRAILPAVLIEVRRSEMPEPAIGDTVEIDDDLFEIIATPVADSLRLVWTCEAALKA
jgi:hypothetical protein